MHVDFRLTTAIIHTQMYVLNDVICHNNNMCMYNNNNYYSYNNLYYKYARLQRGGVGSRFIGLALSRKTPQPTSEY